MLKDNRVVITGYGVLLPNIVSLSDLNNVLLKRIPLYDFHEELRELKFACQVAGKVGSIDHLLKEDIQVEDLYNYSENTKFAIYAGLSAWRNANLKIPDNDEIDYNQGILFGSSVGSLDYTINKVIPAIDEKRAKRIGSFGAQNVMQSNASAHLSGMLKAGGFTTGFSNACSSSTDTIVEAYYQIIQGRTERVLVGGVETGSMEVWSLFDSIFVSNRNSNDKPKQACKPFSDSLDGVIPCGGAAALVIESYESAKARDAKVLAEIVGAYSNCGAQKNGGSMNYPNQEGVIRCIEKCIQMSSIEGNEIDLINGHFTATKADILEVENWKKAFDNLGLELPYLQSSKSYFGHAIGAAGAVETCAVLDQMKHNYIHPNLNCDKIHPEILKLVDPKKIIKEHLHREVNCVIKANFGFGDVNACVILKKI